MVEIHMKKSITLFAASGVCFFCESYDTYDNRRDAI